MADIKSKPSTPGSPFPPLEREPDWGNLTPMQNGNGNSKKEDDAVIKRLEEHWHESQGHYILTREQMAAIAAMAPPKPKPPPKGPSKWTEIALVVLIPLFALAAVATVIAVYQASAATSTNSEQDKTLTAVQLEQVVEKGERSKADSVLETKLDAVLKAQKDAKDEARENFDAVRGALRIPRAKKDAP
jgi:hypothetical protein